jgi:hypothetical protein
MKKMPRKLNLCRETLRVLESPHLRPVQAGGGPQTIVPSCQTNCDLTWTCTDFPTKAC